ncbi:hypothetical protein LEP1GSC086_3180 [Leptospira weilii str. LNT 1234]|nr:hypothetical protein LEP1GSC086_3180 [Leptospira weilii str. LNT 1234]
MKQLEILKCENYNNFKLNGKNFRRYRVEVVEIHTIFLERM